MFLQIGLTYVNWLWEYLNAHRATAIIASFVLIPLITVVYNRRIHPLSKFPSPFFGSITDIYKTYLFSTKEFHLKSLALHEQYGPYVRIAPNLLSISDPYLIPKIYHRHADKTPFYSTGLAGEVASLLQIQDDQEHAANLKALAPTFSMKNLQSMEEKVDERILMTLETLKMRLALKNEEVDLADWIRWYVYDTITDLIYGEPTGMVKSGQDVDHLIKSWHDMFRLGGLVATLPWLVHPIISFPLLRQYLMPQPGHKSGSGHIMSSHQKLFLNRLNNPHSASSRDIFESLRSATWADGATLSLEEVQRQCYLFTVAGQNTTAALISAVINQILQEPPVYSKILAEIDEFQQKSELTTPVVKFDETARMPYFMACIRETLRIAPPTPIILPRYVSSGGMLINGIWIPPKTEIAANPYPIHRDKRIFGKDANIFRLERWLEDPAQIKLMDKYDFAWGYGSRKCIGKSLALLDAQKFCVQFLREFDLCPTSNQMAKSENWGISIYFKQKVMLFERKPCAGCNK